MSAESPNENSANLEAVNQMLRAQITALNRKVITLAGDASRAREAQVAAEARANSVKNTLSYQLGYLIIHLFKSPKNIFLFPVRLWRTRQEARARKNGKKGPKALPRATNATPLFLGSLTALPSNYEPRPFVPLRRIPTSLKNLKVAGILDAFSAECFRHECEFLPLTPTNWQQELQTFQPDFVFIESAWDGNNGLWNRKVAPVGPELPQLLDWCHANNLPTAFWNKEDPVHFETFIDVARNFDTVFTTEVACVPQYQQRLGHNRVYVLPFACQPRIHNPLEIGERKQAFCFAGSYYTRYPERQQDLATFVSTLSGLGRVIIYDRNSHPGNPDYSFPAEYQPFIVGSLAPQDIQVAYKGYTFGINMNSIKQSATMFARRVFELMASNTHVVSNFSMGLKLLFGNLVVATDNTEELHKQVSELLKSEHKSRAVRDAALRKVLQEHTYAVRFQTVVEALAQQPVSAQTPHILVVAKANSAPELARIQSAFESQTHTNRSLVIVCEPPLAPPANAPANTQFLSHTEAASSTLASLCANAAFVAPMHPADHYGPHYLSDYALATSYIVQGAMGKSTHFNHSANNSVALQNPSHAHTAVTSLPLRAACIPAEYVGSQTASDLANSIAEGTLTQQPLTALGEFGYCRNAHAFAQPFSHATHCNGETAGETGTTLNNVCAWLADPKLQKQPEFSDSLLLQGPGLHNLFPEQQTASIALTHCTSGICISSQLPLGKHDYIYAPRNIELCPGQTLRDFSFSTTAGLNVSLTLFFLNSTGEKLGHTTLHSGRMRDLCLPQGTERVRIALRIAGPGTTALTRISMNNATSAAFAVCGTSPYLLLTNRYPSHADLYKNAFVHRRVVQYQKHGVRPDVFQFRANVPPGYHEFEGVTATTGYTAELQVLLASHPYKAILVHFLEPDMWAALKPLLPHTKIIVWCHGSEIQHWKRRACNYPTEAEQQKAERLWAERSAFWHDVFAHCGPNLQLVFVSRTLANEVMADYNIALTHFEIIPNFVDTELFRYEKKDPELRKRILTIRPFTAPNYACDLVVKTIQELSKRPFFAELSFTIVGDGPLFNETVAPVRNLPNVTLRQEFLTQPAIAQLHRQHGIFLCPTRADTQGVSRDEAMASGLVPITNAVGAVPEFLNSECGFLAPENNVASLELSLVSLYNEPQTFASFSRAASQHVLRSLAQNDTIAKEVGLFENERPQHSIPKALP